jgi:hypothetical protein
MRKLKSVIFAVMGMIMAGNLLFSTIYCRVEGFVKDKDTGKGLPNVKVILYQSITDLDNVQTDSNGYFVFKKVDPGEDYFIVCKDDNYVLNFHEYIMDELSSLMDNPAFRKMAGFFTLKEGDIKSFVINLEKGGKIKGKIYQKDANGRKPMFNCFVDLMKECEESDFVVSYPHLPPRKSITIDHFLTMTNAKIYSMEDGEFYFNGLRPSDKYFLTLQSFYGFACQFIKLSEVRKGETLYIDFTFDLEEQTGVKGKVTKNGVPLKSVYIELWEMPEEKYASNMETDKEGNYWIRMVKPGLYRVDFTYYDAVDVKHEREFTIKISANETKIINIEF